MADAQIFVLVEHRDGELLKPSLEALGEALDMAEAAGENGPEVVAVLLMGEIEDAAPSYNENGEAREHRGQSQLLQNEVQENRGRSPLLQNQLAKYGPHKIIAVQHPALQNFSADAWASALLQAVQSSVLAASAHPTGCSSQSFSCFLLSATPNGKELAPRLAVLLGAGLVADSVRVRWERGGGGQAEIGATVPLYGDRVYSQQQITGPKAVVTFRPGARGPDRAGERGNAMPEIIEVRPELSAITAGTQHLKYVPADPRTVTLSEAEKIVCGGAGVGQERFEMMWQLADELGAAVGGTRVAVDKGWLDWDRQIGQTGQVVAPRLFVSCGTSGASQHVTGMKDARTIVVINSDRNAPMFSLADIGVVGNVHEVVPGLIKKLHQLRQSEKAELVETANETERMLQRG